MTTTDNDVKVIQQQQHTKKWIKFWDDDDKCTSYKIQTFFPFIYTFLFYIPFASQTTLWRWWLCWWYRIVIIYTAMRNFYAWQINKFCRSKEKWFETKTETRNSYLFFRPWWSTRKKKTSYKTSSPSPLNQNRQIFTNI